MPRAIDLAMGEDRPAKQYVRQMWIEAVASVAQTGLEPVYMTLCGRAGPEIEMLIEKGVIGLTETGAIAAADGQRVIAVESSPDAVVDLQRRYPGLKILDQSIHDIIGKASPVAWPTGDKRRYCRARVINLDFDKALSAETAGDSVLFRDLDVVSKLAQLHALDQPIDWKLFITYNASLPWAVAVKHAVFAFLRENFDVEPDFRAAAEQVLGQRLMTVVLEDDIERIDSFTKTERQLILMAFVPKKIGQLVHNKGWLVRTERSLRYGGSGSAAPMVTFSLSFRWDTRSASTPHAVYRETLRSVLANVGHIADDGTVGS